MLGGDVEIGPTAEGGFRVSATVPVQAAQYRKGKPELQVKLASLGRP